MSKPLLQLNNVFVQLNIKDRTVYAVSGVSLTIEPNQTVALVGESGCGKSLLAKSILRLHGSLDAKVTGEFLYKGENLLLLDENAFQKIRGNRISMIYQEPMTALNPALSVGFQLKECLIVHKRAKGNEAKQLAIEILEKVEIEDAVKRYKAYPHELSGGMQQRIIIAMALITHPELVIADEPTTALDATVQMKVLNLLGQFKEQEKMSLLIISHDINVVRTLSDVVYVMYGGIFIEKLTSKALADKALHPYTKALIQCVPKETSKERLNTIPGEVYDLGEPLKGCPFYERCDQAVKRCQEALPPFIKPFKTDDHEVRCWLYA